MLCHLWYFTCGAPVPLATGYRQMRYLPCASCDICLYKECFICVHCFVSSFQPIKTYKSTWCQKCPRGCDTGSLPVEMHTGCDSFGATLAVCNMNQSNVRRSVNNVTRAVEGIILLVSVGSQEAGQFGVTLTLLLWG